MSRWGAAGGTAALGWGQKGAVAQGPRRARGYRAGATQSVAVPGPGPPGSGGGRPARLLSGIFRRGARRRFLCPSFRFPLARPPHSWSHREWGRGPGAGRPWLAPSGWDCVVGCWARDWDPSPARPSPLPAPGCGWVRERGARGITQRWAALLGFFHLPAAEAGEGPSPSQQGQSPALESGCRFRAFTPTLLLQLAMAVPTKGLNTAWSVVFLNLKKTSLGSSFRVKARTKFHPLLTLQRSPVLGGVDPAGMYFANSLGDSDV